MSKKKAAHPLLGQRLQATGGGPDGYLVKPSGMIDAHDADGNLVRPPFNVSRKLSLVDAAARLEEHIRKNARASGVPPHALSRPRSLSPCADRS